MRRTKLETARGLAASHFKVEPNLKQIYLLEPLNESDDQDPIKLLEVVEGTFECGIEPVGFAADPANGIDYPFVIVELSPREYGDFSKRGNLHFRSRDWTIGPELIAS